MTTVTDHDELQEIVSAGERIYAEKFKAQYEANFPDQYLVINIDTEQAVLGKYPEDAVIAGRKQFGSAKQHLIRIGSSSAVQLGFFYPYAGLARAV